MACDKYSNTKEGPYKGYLMIKCDDCGQINAYRAKHETFVTVCSECGGEILLEELRPAFMECKCGRHYKYMTNQRTPKITHECMFCGCPVDMELNRKGTTYVTTGREAYR